jgi:hypothetical protein
VSLYTSSYVATPRSGWQPCFAGNLEGLVDVVDREGHAVHADLVWPGGLGLDRVGVDVLEELEASVAVRCLQAGDVGVVAVEADGGVGPLSPDRVTAQPTEQHHNIDRATPHRRAQASL